jgi:protein subunit release factor A
MDDGSGVGVFDAAVKLIHTQTGIEMTCDEFPTQIENYIAATIRLRIACDSETFDRPS